MRRNFALLVVVAALAAGSGCGNKQAKVGVTSLAPPIFQVVYSDPSTGGGLPGAVGTIVQMNGGLQAWQKRSSSSTDWVPVPTSGGGLSTVSVVDGGGIKGNGSPDAGLALVSPATGALIGPVVGSSTASFVVTGLNGETDGDYEGIIHLVSGASANLLFLPNGSSANTESAYYQIYSGGLSPALDDTSLVIGNFTVGDTVEIHWRISSKKQAERLFEARSYRNVSGTKTQWYSTGMWTAPATTMTGFTIPFTTNTGGDVGAGSFMKWRALGFSAG